MKILQINGYESPGRRFNGLSLEPLLRIRKIWSTHLVWEKDTKDLSVISLSDNSIWFERIIGKVLVYFSRYPLFCKEYTVGQHHVSLKKMVMVLGHMSMRRALNWMLKNLERVLSLQSVLFLNSLKLSRIPAYKDADLVHLHIIHSGYLSLWSLPRISRQKPTVWTLHDPWAMTGHCVYPFGCALWKTGCGACPNLSTPLPLYSDRTNLLFRYKKFVYRRSRIDVIVASRWMLNMVRASPLFEGIRVHHVPFGLDLKLFSPTASPFARKKLGIPVSAIVLCFRSEDNEYKGLKYIMEALDRINSQQPICLLTFAQKGLVKRFANRFQLVELGWTHDEVLMRDALVAADMFLMPSTAEAFGVMAIEAMACGKPVISFSGTSIPEVTFAPEVGISVPMGDSNALFVAVQRLIDRPDERLDRGVKGRLMAEQYYNIEDQADRIAEIYKLVVAR